MFAWLHRYVRRLVRQELARLNAEDDARVTAALREFRLSLRKRARIPEPAIFVALSDDEEEPS